MAGDKMVILVTGAIAGGKTTLLERAHQATRKRWQACGFVSPGDGRTFRSDRPATSYRIALLDGSMELPWAARRRDDEGYDFDEASRIKVEHAVRSTLDEGNEDICFLDEIGRQEIEGRGFSDLFRVVLASQCRIIVAAVKKNFVEEVMTSFNIDEPIVIDLDTVTPKQGLRQLLGRISGLDAERIGVFAGIAGLVEVGLGSTLHAYKVPFKGHLLAYLQNVLLIAFGKALRGRGLVRIAFISAMLKAFSPIGEKLRPMLYIFFQGAIFAFPIRLIGWNAIAVLLGSISMAWFTLALSLAVDYVTFGRSIFDAFSGVLGTVGGWLGVGKLSLTSVIVGLFVLKALLAAGVAVMAFYGDIQPLIRRLGRKPGSRVGLHPVGPAESGRRTTLGAAWYAFRDLVSPRFLLFFLVSVLLMLFFTNLSRADFLSVVLRGLCISYLGFLVIRRVDVHVVGHWLDRRMGLGLGKSLPIALKVLSRPPESKTSKTDPDPDGTPSEPRKPDPDVSEKA